MKVSMLLKSCFLVQCLIWTTNSQPQRGTIQTSSGWIRGSSLSVNGRRVYQYLGIPYADPPLGNLRFRKPQPIQPWSGTLKANRMPPACIQYAVYPFPWYDFQEGKSENCLYLNVWVPETKHNNCNKKKKSVMFWIHGGAYAYGSIRKPIYNGRVLAAEGDVIVVTTNYRLGAFGFFTTNTDTAPVNVALYDMLEALKWVHKNIGGFGGDPNQVTVFGQSAGSWSAGLFCVSPLTKGLFHRVIMESGSHAYIPFDDNTTSLTISQRLAEDLGCADAHNDIFTSPDKVADCMRTKDALEIAKTLNSFNPNLGMTYNAVYGNEFLPDNAREDLILGKFHNVSVLIGANQDEGSILLTLSYPQYFGFFGKKRQNFNASTADNLFRTILNDTLKDVTDTDNVTQTILGRLSTNDYRKNRKIIYDFMGDFLLICPAVYFAESYSRYGKDVYFYFFEHRPSSTPRAKWVGVTHYEEVQFVFGSPKKTPHIYTDEEVELSKLVMKMWSNFAKYGNPLHGESSHFNPRGADLLQRDRVQLEKWPIYSREVPLYLKLDTTTLKTKRYKFGPHKANCDLLRPVHGFP